MIDNKLVKKISESEIELTPECDSETSPEKFKPVTKVYKEESELDLNDAGNLGDCVEGYFFLKLKKYLNAPIDFRGVYSIVNHIKKLNESILLYIKEKAKIPNESSDAIKIKGINLIQEVENIFGTNSEKIQIDSLFPNIKGSKIKNLLNEIKNCGCFSKNLETNISDKEEYNLIVESTHNILSTINKKSRQLRNYFTIFSKTRKFYSDNNEILKQFYIGFLKYFKIISKDKMDFTHEELLKKSNYIYIICSNKNYKSTKIFQESLYDQNQLKNLINQLQKAKTKEENNTQKKGGKNELTKKTNNEEYSKNEKKENSGKDGEKKRDEKEFDKNKKGKNNNSYNPGEYIEKFKNTLDMIEKENDGYLLVYFDCYEKLFIPYTTLEEQMNDMKENLYLIGKVLQKLHPEFFNEKGKIDYEKIKQGI